MSKKLLLFFFLLPVFVGAQNLVPNPSFEDTVNCPFDVGLVNYCLGWNSYRPSPDYYNTCSNSVDAQIPNNMGGYQYPVTGNAYIGFGTSYFQDYREILGRKLSDTLTIGIKYYLSMQVNLANRSYYASDKIGIAFSKVPYNDLTSYPPVNNQAKIYSISVIPDTINWINISGSFIADSAYSYIMIGNFFDDSLTTRVFNDTITTFAYKWAYYYVDNICVTTDSAGCDFGVGIHSVIEPEFSFYPNPANEEIYISANANQKFMCSICSILGCKLKSFVGNGTEMLPIKEIPPGVYFLIIQYGNQKIQKKLIIIH